jgi:hypothetical protein
MNRLSSEECKPGPIVGLHHVTAIASDPHVPWSRVAVSARELGRMGAQVDLMRHPGRPHTITDKELGCRDF